MAKTLVDFLNELKKREECVIKGFSGEDPLEITGKEIFNSTELSTRKLEIDLAGLQPGIYIFSLINADKEKVLRKIVLY